MSSQTDTQPLTLTRQDFASTREVRWCPGCGDYAILSTMQKTLPALNIPKENVVFVSGIGCSSRFPYYMDTFGFHTIHGRAPTVATGLKIANPELTVFVVTGDGDGLSIGANHLLHLMRRNVNVTVLLFNNRIYGLTKGQFSPTSEMGKKTKSSPMGSLEPGLDPLQFALGANASFIARAIDVDSQGLQTVIEQAVEHQGTSFIEIYQNCNVFNDGAFQGYTERANRASQTLVLKAGEPMVFGEKGEKGLILEEGVFKVIETNQVEPMIYQNDLDPGLLWQLATLPWPNFPVVTGVLRQVQRPVFESQMSERNKTKSVSEVMFRDVWQVG